MITTASGSIDVVIANQGVLIELLQENRQALVTQAVTKGWILQRKCSLVDGFECSG